MLLLFVSICLIIIEVRERLPVILLELIFFQSLVAALIELSKYRLPTIATTIVTVIESVSKVIYTMQFTFLIDNNLTR